MGVCRNDERLSRFFFPSKNLLRSLTLIIYALKSLMYARWAMRRSHMRSSGVLAFSFLCFASLVSAAWPSDPSSYLLFFPPEIVHKIQVGRKTKEAEQQKNADRGLEAIERDDAGRLEPQAGNGADVDVADERGDAEEDAGDLHVLGRERVRPADAQRREARQRGDGLGPRPAREEREVAGAPRPAAAAGPVAAAREDLDEEEPEAEGEEAERPENEREIADNGDGVDGVFACMAMAIKIPRRFRAKQARVATRAELDLAHALLDRRSVSKKAEEDRR